MSLLDDPAPSAAVVVGLPLLAAAVAAAVVVATGNAATAAGRDDADASSLRRRTALVLVAWFALTGALAGAGLLSRFDVLPPPLMLVVVPAFVALTALAFSPFGTLLARHTPLAALVGFQAFRIPLEVMLHQLGLDGVLPVQMTWDGMNWDVVSGATAALVGAWAAFGRVPRVVLLAWNLLGTLLLAVIVTIAVLSAPVPFRAFWNEPANTIVATFPFVWLPTVLVQAAWFGHLLVFRRLRAGA